MRQGENLRGIRERYGALARGVEGCVGRASVNICLLKEVKKETNRQTWKAPISKYVEMREGQRPKLTKR